MPHTGRKRKGLGSTGPSSVLIHASAPTLKEHIWSELRSVIYKHSTVPLINKEPNGPAMQTFRWVIQCLCNEKLTVWVFRAKICTDWEHFTGLMDSSGFPACPGEAATVEELHRVALTVALAISNPCK